MPDAAAPGPAVLEVRGRSAADDVALTVLPRAEGAPARTAGELPLTGGPGPVGAVLAAAALAGAAVLRRA